MKMRSNKVNVKLRMAYNSCASVWTITDIPMINFKSVKIILMRVVQKCDKYTSDCRW